MELPHKGTVRGAGMWARRNSSVWRPASASEVAEATHAASRPERVCMDLTTSSIRSSWSASAWTTMSGPSALGRSASSVISVAISMITCRAGSSPVISRSIQASNCSDAERFTFHLVERVSRNLEQRAIRIVEVQGVLHAIWTEVLDLQRVESCSNGVERLRMDRDGNVMHAADGLARSRHRVFEKVEERQQVAIADIEEEVRGAG